MSSAGLFWPRRAARTAKVWKPVASPVRSTWSPMGMPGMMRSRGGLHAAHVRGDDSQHQRGVAPQGGSGGDSRAARAALATQARQSLRTPRTPEARAGRCRRSRGLHPAGGNPGCGADLQRSAPHPCRDAPLRHGSSCGTESRYAAPGMSRPVPAPHRTAAAVIQNVSTEGRLAQPVRCCGRAVP